MIDWHIGCSGFHYKHWKGTFYPEKLAQKRWFEYYAGQFPTLELNVTFYRFPRLEVLRTWYDKSPADFRFAIKAPKAIIHYKQFHGTVDMLTSFYSTIREGLQDKLGPVLFQFSPRFRYEPERMARVLDQLNPGFDNVLEFRHPGWWRGEVYDALRQRGVSFCGMSYPGLPDEPVVTSNVVYYRFHGIPDLYRSSYSEEQLNLFTEKFKANPAIKQVWCYFNNDAAVAAIPNARSLTNWQTNSQLNALNSNIKLKCNAMPSAVSAAYEYDASSETLTIRYRSGKVYNYLQVPEMVFRQMRSTMVKGIWFNRHIKGKYSFEEVTPGLKQNKLFP